jgi:hypothetical protein
MDDSSFSFILFFTSNKRANSRRSHLELILAFFRLSDFENFRLGSTLENGPHTSFRAIPAFSSMAVKLFVVVFRRAIVCAASVTFKGTATNPKLLYFSILPGFC